MSKFAPWLYGIVALLIVAGLFYFGHTRYQDGLKAGELELQTYKGQVEQQRALDATAAKNRLIEKTRALNAASQRLDAVDQALTTALDQLNRRLSHAAETPKPVAGHPAPGLLSVDGLRFYNDSLGLQTGSASSTPRESGQEDSTAGTADSGVSREDLLAHIRDYGLWCRQTAAQRDELINSLGAQDERK